MLEQILCFATLFLIIEKTNSKKYFCVMFVLKRPCSAITIYCFMYKQIIYDTFNAKLRKTKTMVPLVPMCALSARKGDQLCQKKVT